jgi:hypothetical protein
MSRSSGIVLTEEDVISFNILQRFLFQASCDPADDWQSPADEKFSPCCNNSGSSHVRRSMSSCVLKEGSSMTALLTSYARLAAIAEQGDFVRLSLCWGCQSRRSARPCNRWVRLLNRTTRSLVLAGATVLLSRNRASGCSIKCGPPSAAQLGRRGKLMSSVTPQRARCASSPTALPPATWSRR